MAASKYSKVFWVEFRIFKKWYCWSENTENKLWLNLIVMPYVLIWWCFFWRVIFNAFIFQLKITISPLESGPFISFIDSYNSIYQLGWNYYDEKIGKKHVSNLIVSPSFSCSSSFLQFESTIDEIFIRQNSNPYSQLFLASSSQKSLGRGGKVFVEYKFPTTNLTYT